MKVKMHYIYGKKRMAACGRTKVFTTTNVREITCKGCLQTHVHKTVKSASVLDRNQGVV